MSDSAVQTDEILFDRIGSAAIMRLNRPKALNSLNLAMVHAMKPALERSARWLAAKWARVVAWWRGRR